MRGEEEGGEREEEGGGGGVWRESGGRGVGWVANTPDTHMRCTIVLGAGGRATATQQPISSV